MQATKRNTRDRRIYLGLVSLLYFVLAISAGNLAQRATKRNFEKSWLWTQRRFWPARLQRIGIWAGTYSVGSDISIRAPDLRRVVLRAGTKIAGAVSNDQPVYGQRHRNFHIPTNDQ